MPDQEEFMNHLRSIEYRVNDMFFFGPEIRFEFFMEFARDL